MEDGRIFDYIFSPYFIEPYAVGQTAHVIGWREPPDALRTLKIERIRARAKSPTTAMRSPPTSTPAGCCGMPGASGTPTPSRWRWCCASTRAWRCGCKESRWHPSQQIEEQPDGSLFWRAQVAEPQEMLPWIRGWGAECEVVEPAELREMMEGEARRLAEIYDWRGSRGELQPEAKPSLSQTFQDFFGVTDKRLAALPISDFL